MSDHTSLAAIYRILDASANRASEGLRTLEEYARFALEDRYLSESAKTIRHELHAALSAVPPAARLQARSVKSDCGTQIVAEREMQRADLTAIAGSAAARTQQSLRCLEEYLKPVSVPAAAAVEALRYRTYTLAAALMLLEQKCERLARAKLYLLVGSDADEDRFSSTVESLFQAGADMIQLRDKIADDALLYRLSGQAAAIARRLGKWFIVNDRADIAAASGAQGVHVGQDELPVAAVRKVLGPHAIVGVSTHCIEQVRAAVDDGADYIGCGPTFPSRTKEFDRFAGLAFLQSAAGATTLPAYAIGGIELANLDQVMACGIHGVAVSSAIMATADPVAMTNAFRQQLDEPRAAAPPSRG